MIRSFFTAIVYSNFWIACGAAALSAQTQMLFGAQIDPSFIGFIFLSTWATYNFQRLLRFNKWWLRATSGRVHWLVKSRKSLAVLTFLTLAGAGLLASSAIAWTDLWVLLPAAAVAVLYALPFIRLKDQKQALRDIPGLKIFWIGGSWAAITAILPLMDMETWQLTHTLSVLDRLFFILAITVPFDVRDLAYDPPGQRTIPQVFGVFRSGWLAVLLNFVFVLLVLWNGWIGGYPPGAVIALIAAGAVNTVVLAFAFKVRPEQYYSFLLDGLTILQPVLVFVAIR